MPAIACPITGCTYTTPAEHSIEVAVTLLNLHGKDHDSNPTSRADKVKRPVISSSGTTEEWDYFESRWTEYKRATNITGTEATLQLLECCDESLRRDVTRANGGSLSQKNEDEVLKAIRTLAVKEENIMVLRVELSNKRQDRDEPIRNFAARLRGHASQCKFNVECTDCHRVISYMDLILKDHIIRGLSDQEIQLEVLAHQDQDMTLESLIKLIEAKESGRRSAHRLQDSTNTGNTTTTAAAASAYRTSQSQALKSCGYCGAKAYHGTRFKDREQKCPAAKHKCKKCDTLGHFEKVCRKSRNDDKTKNRVMECSEEPPQFFCTLYDCMNVVENDAHKGSYIDGNGNDTFIPQYIMSNENEYSCIKIPINNEYTCTNTATHTSTGRPTSYEDKATFTATASGISQASPIPHHVYESNVWVQRQSDPQPSLAVQIKVCPSDYKALGVPHPPVRRTLDCIAIADTGCQSSLAGMDILSKLGLNETHLLKVSMKMCAANNKSISILGALLLHINTNEGKETRQMVYFTTDTHKLYLSRSACVDLDLISKQFPASETNDDNAEIRQNTRAPCGCLLRLPPPDTQSMEPPFPLTAENRLKIENYLKDQYASSAFNVCTHQPLPMMTGPPMRLLIDPDAKPTAFHTPLTVPLHWMEEVKADLDRDVRLGVLEQVPMGEPVTWCHRMVVCAKKNGKPRRTVDFQPLNKHAARETHHTQSPFIQARTVPQNTKKTVLDAWNGYHSVPLHEDDRHYTTFITPWGRYRYKVAPQGYISSGDCYTRRYDEITSDIKNKTKCVDDALLWAKDIKSQFHLTVHWIDLCAKNGVTLNPDKFIFGADTVAFAGFEVSPTTVRPCPKLFEAIEHFPTPKNLTDIRSWHGLINQVSYTFASAPIMQPFRDLLRSKSPFTWTQEHDKLFETSKKVIIKGITHGVEIYDKNRPTCLATDWSKSGIGFWLLQKHCRCKATKPLCCKNGWKVALVGSRFTTSAESRYHPIEGEALAVVDALEKARHFVLGCKDLIIAVDHKPLEKVFGDRSLDGIPNPRLRNLKEKSLKFRFKLVHIPGIHNKAADGMSRHPVGEANHLELPDDIATLSHILLDSIRETTPETDHEDPVISAAATALDTIRTITWEDVRTHTINDEEMRELLAMIDDGLPATRKEMPSDLQIYFPLKEGLYSLDGVVMYNDRIVVPQSLRTRVLEALHSAHQGTSSMIARAESSVFWPGITSDIKRIRASCQQCNRNAPSQPDAPPTPPTIPVYPFQAVCADFFHTCGQYYCVIVDRYSNWPIVDKSKEGAAGLITSLRKTFITFGISEELTSDGGPEFSASQTEKFLKNWGVYHRTSSVAYPHSNCRAEVAVKTVKRLLIDNTGPSGTLDTDAFHRAMLQYRNTPDKETGISPAQCIFGRPIRDFVPIHPGRYEPHPTWKETLLAREEALRNRHMKMAERLTEHTRRLPPLKVGDKVRIQNQTGPHPTKWDKTGTVIEVRQYDQYIVKVDGSGRATLRNRKFLRKYTPAISPSKPTSRHINQSKPEPSTGPSQSTQEENRPPPMKLANAPQPEDRPRPAEKAHVPQQEEQPPPIGPAHGAQQEDQPPPIEAAHGPQQEDQPPPVEPAHGPQPPPVVPGHDPQAKIPMALKRLASHNSLGRSEAQLPLRTTRSATKNTI